MDCKEDKLWQQIQRKVQKRRILAQLLSKIRNIEIFIRNNYRNADARMCTTKH